MLAFGKVGAGPELKTDNEHIRWERKNVHKEFSWSSTRGRADFWSEFLAHYLPTSHKARQTGDGIRTTSCGVVVKIVDLSGSVDSQKNKNNNNNNCHHHHLHLSPQHHHHPTSATESLSSSSYSASSSSSRQRRAPALCWVLTSQLSSHLASHNLGW